MWIVYALPEVSARDNITGLSMEFKANAVGARLDYLERLSVGRDEKVEHITDSELKCFLYTASFLVP